jgi:hypothetical protein
LGTGIAIQIDEVITISLNYDTEMLRFTIALPDNLNKNFQIQLSRLQERKSNRK